jgi:hypothetical protein
MLALQAARYERVFELKCRDRLHPMRLGQCLTARCVPGRDVAQADVAHLAGAHEVVQRGHHFFDGRHAIPHVDVVQIDVIVFSLRSEPSIAR